MGRPRLHAIRIILRLHGRESGKVAKEIFTNGPRIGLSGGSGKPVRK
jgi:hypothetical protein